ncbi:HD domain-containing phosphohydrolase [Sporomusa aerivorans]|uniref:HD domain-containing phosphohydrolase n=1 Tax=Sporomusa aerivorans TaxID=204936 RepID=UPI00352AA132
MDDLYRQNNYLTALHDTALALMNNLDSKELLKSMVVKAGELVGTEHGFIALFDEADGNFKLQVAIGFYARHSGLEIVPGLGVVGQVISLGETCIVNDYANWPGRYPDVEYNSVNAVIGMPLKAQGQLAGIIGLAYLEARLFTQEEVIVLSRFADLASIALINARLYTALQQELAERRQFEKKLEYISYHDALTGLCNRALFKREMSRLEAAKPKPIGIVLCDVDGLKLINDTLGHEQGDSLLNAAADIIKGHVRADDIVARIGGDEFAILLPKADCYLLEDVCARIRYAVDKYNAAHLELPLSMSIGFAASGADDGELVSMNELFREADDNMYREKLHRSRSSRSAIVKALLKALEIRDFITEGHGDRMQFLAANVAAVLMLSERRTADIKLLAQFHDIGKVGIPDRILFKPDQLTLKEQVEMQRHAEIGYRIAQSVSDLIPIADFILKHHEWWNGNGYPIGLTGEEIPLECRIIAIVDAYDAMTSDRPYRKAMPAEAAVDELKRRAGSQFDPGLVALFCELLSQNLEERVI